MLRGVRFWKGSAADRNPSVSLREVFR